MSSGKLGSAAPAADTDTVVYTVPANTVASVNVAVVNRGAAVAAVRLAVALTGTPATDEYLEYDVQVPADGGVLERSAIVCGAGEKVVFYADSADCSVRVHGFEEDA